jgi:hypothetical protein
MSIIESTFNSLIRAGMSLTSYKKNSKNVELVNKIYTEIDKFKNGIGEPLLISDKLRNKLMDYELFYEHSYCITPKQDGFRIIDIKHRNKPKFSDLLHLAFAFGMCKKALSSPVCVMNDTHEHFKVSIDTDFVLTVQDLFDDYSISEINSALLVLCEDEDNCTLPIIQYIQDEFNNI